MFSAKLYRKEGISRNRYLKNELILGRMHLEFFFRTANPLTVFGEIIAVYCENHIE